MQLRHDKRQQQQQQRALPHDEGKEFTTDGGDDNVVSVAEAGKAFAIAGNAGVELVQLRHLLGHLSSLVRDALLPPMLTLERTTQRYPFAETTRTQ